LNREHDLCAVRIHIATGSNLGDRINHLEEADRRMALRLGQVVRVSPTYRTGAMGMAPGTPDFLNRISEVELNGNWADQPEQVMQALLAIEQEMGRIRQPEGYTSRSMGREV
jgi:deoxyguanosine kinase